MIQISPPQEGPDCLPSPIMHLSSSLKVEEEE